MTLLRHRSWLFGSLLGFLWLTPLWLTSCASEGHQPPPDASLARDAEQFDTNVHADAPAPPDTSAPGDNSEQDEAAPPEDIMTDSAGVDVTASADATGPDDTGSFEVLRDIGAEDALPDGTINTAPRFDTPPVVTLEMGTHTTLDLNTYVDDTEDRDALLVFSWSAVHVALRDPGDHTLTIIAPVDWHGTEAIELTVTDRGGLTATATLSVVVTEREPPPDPDCHDQTFLFAAGVDAQVVLLSGSFNGWGENAETAAAMTDADADGVWEVTIQLADGRYEYKFWVDGEWIVDPDNPETVPDCCGGVNSVLVVACDDPTPPDCDTSFVYDSGAAGGTAPSSVFVAGSFNEWSDSADELTDSDDDGVFEHTMTLAPERYTYKFVVDGEWIADPSNPDGEDDGFGGTNSVLVVPQCEVTAAP